MSDTITITGNIAADPERRLTGTGVPVTTFRVASSQRRFDAAKQQWVETGTNWYQVSAFRSLALHAYASLHRGERVIVTGRLRLRRWETPTKSGLSVEINADGIGHDLLWGTSQYSRAGRDGTSWSASPADGDDDTQADGAPVDDDAPAAQWAVAVPGEAAAPRGAVEHPGDWGAPAQGQSVGDGRDVDTHPDAPGAHERELQDVPF